MNILLSSLLIFILVFQFYTVVNHLHWLNKIYKISVKKKISTTSLDRFHCGLWPSKSWAKTINLTSLNYSGPAKMKMKMVLFNFPISFRNCNRVHNSKQWIHYTWQLLAAKYIYGSYLLFFFFFRATKIGASMPHTPITSWVKPKNTTNI